MATPWTGPEQPQPTQGQSWFQQKKQAILVLGLAVVAIFAYLGYEEFIAKPAAEAASIDEVVYEIDGTAVAAMVTMTTSTGITQHDVDVPWETTLRTLERGDAVSISAQNQFDTGSVTCRIVVDGVTIASNTSTAEYGVASCSGVV